MNEIYVVKTPLQTVQAWVTNKSSGLRAQMPGKPYGKPMSLPQVVIRKWFLKHAKEGHYARAFQQ